MDNLKPMTREESIISGNDLKPLNRHEYYLKYIKGSGGGGTAANGIVVRPVTPDEVAGLLPEGSSASVDNNGAVVIDVIAVSGQYGNKVRKGAYRIVKNVENPYYAIIDAHDATGTKKPVPIDLLDPPQTINKCSDDPNGMIVTLTIDKSFERIVSIPGGIIIPDDAGFTTYLDSGVS